ncbi:Rep protein [Priestia megaterium]|uniref:Rep protein n=1 Tax=Priestia TaxID=2800373 RepID=UPI000AD2EDBC|nr:MULTISPECIES: Rep protein [Priestia]MBU8757634.1 Rep protein [Priestia megaterium]MBY0200399.1 Rep protein [Priestia megaterium]MDH3135342.1 Rep protein [Priestia aryabhattai]MDN4634474.1 Rep protein [Sphingomonas sp. PsM26]
MEKNKNNIVDLQKKLAEAERKARLKDLTKTSYSSEEVSEIQRSLLDLMQEITGEKHFIGKEKDIFAGEPFNQTMHRNLDLLTRINYLTTAEESFLFRIQAYLEFKSNVIVCREDKFKKKRKNVVEDDYELPKAATVSDIAEMIGKSREKTSLIMNSLKKKEILLNPEGAGQVSENGRSVSPRTWIVNPYIMICAPRKNEVKLDKLTMRLFQHSLKNLKDQNGKKVNLPVRFF